MKKVTIVLALLAALPLGLKAQMFAFWDGDNRIGVSTGTMLTFEKPTLTFSNNGMATSFQQTELSQKFTPKVGLLFGGERELSNKLTMGIYTYFDVSKPGFKARFEGKNDSVFAYDVSYLGLEATEFIDLGYFINDDLELQGGIGVALRWDIPRKGQETLLVGGAEKMSGNHADGFGTSMGFGMGGNVGINYYLSENFFLRGNVAFLWYFFTTDRFKGDDEFFATHVGDLAIRQNNLNALDISITIGFLWD